MRIWKPLRINQVAHENLLNSVLTASPTEQPENLKILPNSLINNASQDALPPDALLGRALPFRPRYTLGGVHSMFIGTTTTYTDEQ